MPVLLTGVATWIATAGGPRHDPDSASYLWAARRLLVEPWSVLGPQSFSGVAEPARFPPMYPVVLALTGSGQGTAFRVAAVLIATTTVALVVGPLQRHTGPLTAAAAGLAVLCARPFLFRVQAFVMSDAWFLLSVAGTVAAVTMAVQASSPRQRWSWVLVTAALAATASLLRVAGLGVAAAAATSLVILVPGAGGRRGATAVAALGTAPLALWLGLQRDASGLVAARAPEWHGFGWSDLQAAADSWLIMALPGDAASGAVGIVLRSVLAASTIAAALWSVRRLHDARAGRRPVLQAVWLLTGWTSLAVLVVARAVADPFLVPSDRHLMTAWTAAVCAAALEFAAARHLTHTRSAVRAAAAGAGAIVVVAAAITSGNLSAPEQTYRSLEDDAADSALISAITDLPSSTELHTNRGDLLFVIAGRESIHLPLPRDPATGRARRTYRSELDATIREVCAREAVVVAFLSDELWAPDVGDLIAAGLAVRERRADGMVLGCDT